MDGSTQVKSAAAPADATTRGVRVQRALAAYMALYVSWLALRWGPAGDRKVIGDLFQIGVNVPVAALCWLAARRCARCSPLRLVWRLIASGAVAAAVANVIQLYYEGVTGTLSHPAPSDVLILCGYVLVIAALFRFPTARAGGVQRVQLSLDAAVLAIGGAVVMWYVDVGPALTQHSSEPLAAELVAVVFTLCDLIALAAVAGVLTRGTMASSARALRLFAAGCLTFVAADVITGYLTLRLHRGYAGGDWIDLAWFTGFVLWALAANAQREPDPNELGRLRVVLPVRRRPSWMPYVAVASALGLMVYTGRHNAFFPVLSLMLASVVLVALVAARQLAAQSELIDVQRELQIAHDELSALATTDALTGLPNHRALVAELDRETERSRRSGRHCAIAFIDIDHFKALNDTLGHAVGDAALRECAQIMRSVLRGIDTAGRWGGEEFVVLLPETDSAGALEAAQRIRTSIARHRFGSALGAHLTCSIGVAILPDDGTTRDTLVRKADRAMYAAKQLGRNQVVAACDDAASAVLLGGAASSRDEQSVIGAVEALAAIVDVRDSYTAAHSADVAVLSRRVALMLGCDANETHLIGLAARLHDIGKIAVPDEILSKPGKLTSAEWQLIREHPGVGADIVSRIPRLRPIAPMIRGHHERFDGTGYPDRLAGEEIPLGARIICAADAYNAMITTRPYGTVRSPSEALEELERCAGSQFDRRIVDVLGSALEYDRDEREAA